jgi:hypothetical protein
METDVTFSYQELEQNPMYPGDATKKIPTGNILELKTKVRFIQSRTTTEGYKDSPSGYAPNTFKFLLSTKSIPEDSTFTQFGFNWTVGKEEHPTAFGKSYGFRVPIQVVT